MPAEGRPRFGLDTNVLVYAFDANAGEKQARAERIVRLAAASGRCVLPLQAVGEFVNAGVNKRKERREKVVALAKSFVGLFETTQARLPEVRVALAEAVGGRLSYWDALMLATLGAAGCSVLLSEDMGDGVTVAGVTVRNPFAGAAMPVEVEALLAP